LNKAKDHKRKKIKADLREIHVAVSSFLEFDIQIILQQQKWIEFPPKKKDKSI
jgi:hypothetical protein